MPMLAEDEIRALHPRAVLGASSEVTRREATGDKSVTVDRYEKDVLYDLISPDRIVRKGGGSEDGKPSHHTFMVLDSSTGQFEEAEIALTFPKRDKNELRLYFKRNDVGSFYPSEGENFFILKVEEDPRPYIGSILLENNSSTSSSEKAAHSFNKGRLIDEEDDYYLTIVHQPKEVKGSKQGVTTTYRRDRSVALKALKAAGYECESDNEHETFISEATKMPFMEPHHLIPVSLESEFQNSLDVEANIISLCPNCHRSIHYGEVQTKRDLLAKFFNERIDALRLSGIETSVEYLFEKYGVS